MSGIKIYPRENGNYYRLPLSLCVEYHDGKSWLPVRIKKREPGQLTANTCITYEFDKIRSDKMKIVFTHEEGQVAFSEIEIYFKPDK